MKKRALSVKMENACCNAAANISNHARMVTGCGMGSTCVIEGYALALIQQLVLEAQREEENDQG